MLIFGFAPRLATAQRGPDVPNFPTPQPIVEQMLEMAGVTKNDTVFDLGCGDGRIVVTAAKKYGARGIGVDLNPVCIQQCKEAAKAAHVADRVTIYRQDLFATDIATATVVALYLSPELNVRLRPRLLKELKPGTRVVSYVFDMGDWRPDRSEPAVGAKDYRVSLWVIPAQLTGDWRWTIRTRDGIQSDSLRLAQRYQRLAGTLTVRGAALPLTEGFVQGAKLSFGASGDDGATYRFEGSVSGRQARGMLSVDGGALAGSYAWTLERE